MLRLSFDNATVDRLGTAAEGWRARRDALTTVTRRLVDYLTSAGAMEYVPRWQGTLPFDDGESCDTSPLRIADGSDSEADY
eukprot:gene4080-1313_t